MIMENIYILQLDKTSSFIQSAMSVNTFTFYNQNKGIQLIIVWHL